MRAPFRPSALTALLTLALLALPGCGRPPGPEVFEALREDCRQHYYGGYGLPDEAEVARVEGPIPEGRQVEPHADGSTVIRVRLGVDVIDVDGAILPVDTTSVREALAEVESGRPVLVIDPRRPAADVANVMEAATGIEGLAPPVVVLRAPAPGWSSEFRDPELARSLFEAPGVGAPPPCAAIREAYEAQADAKIGDRCSTLVDGLEAAAGQCWTHDWDRTITVAQFQSRPSMQPELERWVLAGRAPTGPEGATWGEVVEQWATGS